MRSSVSRGRKAIPTILATKRQKELLHREYQELGRAYPKNLGVSTTGKAGGLISPKRAALLATLKGYPTLRITL